MRSSSSESETYSHHRVGIVHADDACDARFGLGLLPPRPIKESSDRGDHHRHKPAIQSIIEDHHRHKPAIQSIIEDHHRHKPAIQSIIDSQVTTTSARAHNYENESAMSSSSSPSVMPASDVSDPLRAMPEPFNDILKNTGYYQPQPPSTFVVAPQIIVAPQVPTTTAAQAPVMAAGVTSAAQSPVMAAATTTAAQAQAMATTTVAPGAQAMATTTVAPGPAGAPHGWSMTTGGLTIVVVVLALALLALLCCMGMRWCCKRRRQQGEKAVTAAAREKVATAAPTEVVVDIQAQTPAATPAATKVAVDIEAQTPVE